MAKIKDFDIESMEELELLGKALSSKVRLEMLRLLYDNALIIGEIAKTMGLPPSSAAFHAKILEQAGLIRMEERPGTRGTMKLCTRKLDQLTISLVKRNACIDEVISVEMPVGAYTDCEVSPTCGLWSREGAIGNEDVPQSFYLPQRIEAQMLWTSSGYVEYKFPNNVPFRRRIKKLTFSAELCSEAPGYQSDWKSDLSLWVNGKECGTWCCPGDYGDKRGRLNPPVWPAGNTQYGVWTSWEIDAAGIQVNGEKVAGASLESLDLMAKPYITIRLGNKPDAKYAGGFNLFGKGYGNFSQDLVLTLEY